MNNFNYTNPKLTTMDKQKRVIIILVCLLIVTIGNYSRNSRLDNIRTIDFLTIWVIGALSGLLIHNIIAIFNKDR